MTTLTLTAPQIASFLHHCCHIIPVSRGYAQQWRDDYAPGWETNMLIGALKEAGAIERGDGHFSGWRPVADLIEVTVTKPGFDWFPSVTSQKEPGLVSGRRHCQVCGQPAVTVTYAATVLCEVHRKAARWAGDVPVMHDWRTGERLE